MGARLIEEYRGHQKGQFVASIVKSADTNVAETVGGGVGGANAIHELLNEESNLSVEDARMIDGAWRGAEAFHFYMLAQRQLYDHNYDAAMRTALVLTDYERFLPPLEIYMLLGASLLTGIFSHTKSLYVYIFIALASCQARQFAVCSRAFMKLESLPILSTAEREQYGELALKIFLKYIYAHACLRAKKLPIERSNCLQKFAKRHKTNARRVRTLRQHGA